MRGVRLSAACLAAVSQAAHSQQVVETGRLSPAAIDRLYEAHRQAAEIWVASHLDQSDEGRAQRPTNAEELDSIAIGGCVVDYPRRPPGMNSPEDRLDQALESLAVEVQWARDMLLRHGFPRDLYAKRLDAFEGSAFSSIKAAYSGAGTDESEESVADVILAIEDAREAAHRRDLPPVESVYCSPPEGAYRAVLRSDPTGATVWYMSDYFRDLCLAQGIDPWSTSRCKYWGASDPRQALDFYGWYQVQARWPNGHTVRQHKRIDGGLATAAGHPVYTITR